MPTKAGYHLGHDDADEPTAATTPTLPRRLDQTLANFIADAMIASSI